MTLTYVCVSLLKVVPLRDQTIWAHTLYLKHLSDIVFPHLSVLSINEVFFSVCLYLWMHRYVYLWHGLCLSSCAGVHLLKIGSSALLENCQVPPLSQLCRCSCMQSEIKHKIWSLLNLKIDHYKKDICWGNCKDLFTLYVSYCSCILPALNERICTLWARRRISHI